MIVIFLRVLSALFIAALIIMSLVYLIVLFVAFCKWFHAYKRIKELYGSERESYRFESYNNFVHMSFERLLKFYAISPNKYKIEHSHNYGGICYLTRTTSIDLTENLIYPYCFNTYYFIMDTFSDFLKYQKFCKDTEKQREQEEQRKEEQQNLDLSDFALGEYVKLVKADIAENEEKINKKIQELNDELQKQKQMIGE